MPRISTVLIIALSLISLVNAEVSLPPWDWSSYNGTTRWVTSVTEDDSGCGGGTYTDQYTVQIEFMPGHALMGNVGHGPASGRVQGDVLSIPGRTVDDPPGSSILSPYDITFSPDCLTFTGGYDWDYSGPDGSCSGSTTLDGRIVNGCPALTTPVDTPSTPPTTEEEDIANAGNDLGKDLQLRSQTPFPKEQIDALEARIEAEYKLILDKDPNNFQANVAMAELKKSQGLPHEYYEYMDRALSGGAVTESVKEEAEKKMAEELGFSKFPKPANSLLMKRVGTEDSDYHGTIYGMAVKKDADEPTWKVRLWSVFAPPLDVVGTLVFR